MINTQDVQDLLANGGTVVGEGDTKIGKIGQVFLDDETSEPEWVTVKTGLFGGAESFIPLQGGSVSGNEIHVPFSKDKVKDAPRVDDSEGHLDKSEESELYQYYGMTYSENTSDSGLPATSGLGQPEESDHTDHTGHAHGDHTDHDDHEDHDDLSGFTGAGQDTSGPETDDAMTRSEERLDLSTEKVSAGKARLRKYIVTENVTQTVPVSHEEVRIEREPITDANRGDAVSGGDLTSEEHEVELSAERVVVDKDVVPVERVTLGTETVTEDQQVSEELSKEQIEADGETGNAGADLR